MIVTFYSFKGGVGRSMALANVGEILADWGYRVILCDWDLEAPGLERYMTSLEYQLASSSTDEEKKRAYEQAQRESIAWKAKPGLMDLLLEYKETMTKSPGEVERRLKETARAGDGDSERVFTKVGKLYLRRPSTYAFPVSNQRTRAGSLRLLTAGQRENRPYELYAEAVRNFRWEEFYDQWAGDSYIEFFRSDLLSEADLVLVDSRTGVTEHGGVATHHLADMVILLSAANQMNVEGTQWMARELTQPSLKKLRGGRKLQVFPLPARIEQTAEREILSAFRREFVDEFRLYAPLLGDPDFYDSVEVPYMPYYSFKERVVAREDEGTRDRMLYKSYKAVARHVVNYGLSEGLLDKKQSGGRSVIGTQPSNRKVKLLSAPVLFSYAAEEREMAETLADGLDAAGLRIVLTPSSRRTAGVDSGLRFEPEVADGAAAHIILAGGEGLSPALKAEFDNALRQCVLRQDFRLVPILPAEVDSQVLPAYAGRLQPIELPVGLQLSSGSDLFLNLAAEISARPSVVPVDETASPLPGFEPFDEGQARFFFGRDAEVIELTKQLGETSNGHVRWLQIEGSNGSGKTSLARAGLVPAVRRGLVRPASADDWRVAKLTLGKDILESLTLALYDPSLSLSQSELQASLSGPDGLSSFVRKLTPPDQAFLLVLDNLEILFSGEVKKGEGELFVEQLRVALTDQSLPFYLLTTLRSDYLTRLNSLPLGEFFFQNIARRYQLKRMNEEALRQAVTGPVKLAGLTMEPGLLERIVSGVLETEEPLALLGSLMRSLWEKRSGATLTHSAFQELGGVRGVLLRSADSLANDLTSSQLERMRKLALELVKAGPATSKTQSQSETLYSIPYTEAVRAAGGDEEAENLLNRLLSAPRLLVMQESGMVGFLHESLVRHWDKLQNWVSQSREILERRNAIATRALSNADPFLGWWQTLQLAIENWERGKRDEKLLLSGSALSEAKRMLAAYADDLNDVEKNFIQLSRKRASRRRRKAVAIVSVALLIVALVSSVLYWRQRRENVQTAETYIKRGQEKSAAGDYDGAAEEFTSAISIDPSSTDAYYQRGLAYQTWGLHKLALEDFKEAIRLNPNFDEAYLHYGISLVETGDFQEAIRILKRAIELKPNSADNYFYRGLANDKFGRMEEALIDYAKAIELNARYAEVYNARGNLYGSMGDYERAIAEYNRAIEINPEFAEALNNRGFAFANARTPDYGLAIDDYNEAIKYAPQSATAFFNRGTAYVRKGDSDSALSDFTKAITLNLQYAQAYNSRCEVYWKFKKQLDLALADCEQAIKINDKFAEAYVNRGQIYALKPSTNKEDESYNFEKAVESYNKALELKPDLIMIYLYRGELYKKRDRTKAAKDFIQFVSLTSDPQLETRARNSLKELSYQTPPHETTVSLRTSQANEQLMGAVRNALVSRGYKVESITDEDVPEDDGDIRYFQPEDEKSANDVEKIIEDTMSQEGYTFRFKSLNGLIIYGRSRRVPFGTIEVRIPLVSPN